MRRSSVVALASLLLVACSDDGTAKTDGAMGTDGATVNDGAAGKDGPNPAGDLGPGTGVLKCGKYQMPPFSKACTQTSDCVVVTHTTDCCGTGKAIGLRKADEAAFKAEEQKCAATYPACGCAPGPTKTDDGSSAPMTANAIAAECVAGICTSYVVACGKVCAGALSCQSCHKGGGNYYAVCSTACTKDAECTDPKLPSCVGSNLGSKFCAAAADGCSP